MAAIDTPNVRRVIQGLCPLASDEVTHGRLYEVLGLETENDKASLRGRLGDLVNRKELIRVQPGVYRYNKAAAPSDTHQGESYIRIWRIVRVEKPGWSFQDVAKLTQYTRSQVRKYCVWLAREGYIAKTGKQGNTQLWRTTQKAKDRRETPYPPKAIPDPYHKEKNAACSLVRAFMDGEPGRAPTRETIIKNCEIILGRFAPAEGETK